MFALYEDYPSNSVQKIVITANMKNSFPIYVILIVCFNAFSSEIQSAPPKDLLSLPGKKVWAGAKAYRSEHGLEEYCYDVDGTYVIYSSNLLGEGYSFYRDRPSERNCVTAGKEIYTGNKLGITVGSESEVVSELLGFELKEGDNSHSWHYQRDINGITFDDYTTVQVIIDNGLITAFELFNTVTH